MHVRRVMHCLNSALAGGQFVGVQIYWRRLSEGVARFISIPLCKRRHQSIHMREQAPPAWLDFAARLVGFLLTSTHAR